MLEFYKNLPKFIDPVAFSIGSFSVYWYSLMYLVGFLFVAIFLYWRVYKKETDISYDDIFDFILQAFLASILGGRLGYVVFYNLDYFFNNPLEIFLPFNKSGEFMGIYGMSYHGGIIGFVVFTYFFCKIKKIDFFKLTDLILPAIPLGYFFGRIGNFLNGELYGRKTISNLGMNFGDGYLRYPSQLFEALGEGLLLFLILWLLRNKLSKKLGMISGLYILGYGLIRFVIEFFREPDIQIGFIFDFLTMGQVLSLIMLVIGLYIINRSLNRNFKKYGE